MGVGMKDDEVMAPEETDELMMAGGTSALAATSRGCGWDRPGTTGTISAVTGIAEDLILKIYGLWMCQSIQKTRSVPELKGE